ncbi:uncharacterized protein NMK_2165 [Novimethylophilus kurashikiensis]|uniref:Uncharacterized protein n=1 Tax=Novimethylophilus kurashikiensis TaxID=1825523 RepID=A0A2R5F8L8_9PROT|nr:hypothetical protein [Novimethylophilus kurashikiensis]GBG14566.1 uncharacterized protein NMK_2165 [Novimethylophilus kurashikiensis]
MYQKIKNIAQNPLVFDISNPVPQDVLEARRNALLKVEKIVSLVDDFTGPLAAISVFASLFCVTLVIGCLPQSNLGWMTVIKGTLMLAVALAVPTLALISVFNLERCCNSILKEIKGLRPMEATSCKEVLACCELHPECDSYRKAVLAEGRTFVEAEGKLLIAHADEVETKAACAALYETQTA